SVEESSRRAAAHEAAAAAMRERLQRLPDESASLRDQLSRERCVCAQYRDLERTYRQQCKNARWLEQQLEEAQARGSQLCGDVRTALHAVRQCLKDYRNQERKIKEQELLIDSLQQRLKTSRNNDNVKLEEDACCPNCVSVRRRRCRAVERETAGCSKCTSRMGERRRMCSATSGSEMASPSSVPTPPQRLAKEDPFQCSVAVSIFIKLLKKDIGVNSGMIL
ncbi:hypothetical protein evm_015165, partial [Chilo suppressalis]